MRLSRIICCIGALAWVAFPAVSWGERSNPYQSIVERNPFALKPPPPPVPPPDPNPVSAVPPPKITLTGIISTFSEPKALLEIVSQEPGKGGAVKRPIPLREGESLDGIDVLSIDVANSVVKIRNGGAESSLTFEVQKPGAGAPHAGLPPGTVPTPLTANPYAPQGPHAPPGAGAAPTVISPGSASPGGGGITMLGGGASTPTAPTPPGVPPAYGGRGTATTTLGGSGVTSLGANPATPGVPTPLGTANNPYRPVPSRTIRTEQPQAPHPPPMTREEAAAKVLLQNEHYKTHGFPPLPVPPEAQGIK